MKKIILIILLLCPNLCYAASQSLFEPHTVNSLWYAWSEYDGTDTEIYCSNWNGTQWTKPYQLTDNSSNDLSPTAAIDNKGNPWIVWIGEDGISTSIYCRHWNGNQWTETRQVDDVDIYEDTNPVITIDNNNVPWVAWTGTDSTDDDIYVSKLLSTGKNWTSPEMINSDDAVPDLMPAINIDAHGNPIVVWCGFYNGRYQLFFSQRMKNNWTEEKLIAGEQQRFSAELPSIFRRQSGLIELLWIEKNLSYTSLWNGKEWSDPESTEILLPEGFFEKLPANVFGLSCVSWTQNDMVQSIRITPPDLSKNSKKFTITKTQNKIRSILVWLNEQIIPSAQADVEPDKYIAFGDSITEFPIREGWEGYPPRLDRKLDAEIGPSTVVNEGVGGERTFEGLNRIDDALQEHNAQFLLLMEGTNDVTYTFTSSSVQFNLEQMIDKATNYGTTTILATLPPRRDGLDSRTRTDYNVKITDLAAEKGLTLVDMYEPLAVDKDANINDHVHPTAAGFEIMTQQWFDAIDSILNPPEEDDDDGGCGFVPPMYPGDKNKGLHKNLMALLVAVCFILLLRRLCYT